MVDSTMCSFCFLVVLSLLGWCQAKLDCPALPPLQQPAKTVHELKPQDIKVVMALGDSITAGFSMMGNEGVNVTGSFSEFRGKSWSMGMDPKALTVPNFLQTYNPHLVGGSLGHHIVELCYNVLCPNNQYRPEQDVFNAAQSGAMVTNLVSHEFDYLLKQLNKHQEVDMQNDWKLLTIFIGTNDVCLDCSGDFPSLDPDNYEKHLREVLEEVRQQIPKVFVNLVLMGNLSGIHNISSTSSYCSTLHRILTIECSCVFASGEKGEKGRLAIDVMAMALNQRMRNIEADYTSKNYSDFAVVVQPFMSHTDVAKFTLSYLSSMDCFHPSLLAHQAMAKALWNNMITPKAEKKTSFTLTDPVKCPTNTTLLYTK